MVMTKMPKVVLLIESSRESGRALLYGVAQYAHHHGPWSFYWEPGGLERLPAAVHAQGADGIVTRDVDLGPTGKLLGRKMPAVVISHRHEEVPGVANVVTDCAGIAQMAARHLLGCGFRNFGFCGYSQTGWSANRAAAFALRIQEAGFEARMHEVRPGVRARGWQTARDSICRWLVKLPLPIGVMACNDDLGKEVMESCRLAGLRVPDDVAVIGADNDELICGLSNPPLSSVAIDFRRAGYEAADVLHQMMRGAKRVPRRIFVRASHVVPRRSTDILAIEDQGMAKALRFIRDHPAGEITVEMAARAAGLSRRVLEKRFRQYLNHSVLEEIRRVRTDRIARMLVETDLPVAQIAETQGFADLHHVARYFRSAKGLSPLAYRKAHSWKNAAV
jgi:LacI family transcriptional regulator